MDATPFRLLERRLQLAGDRGSMLPLLALILFVVFATAMSVAAVGGRTIVMSQAQWAADAAALSAAGVGPHEDPTAAAKLLAEANQATLVNLRSYGSMSPSGTQLPSAVVGGQVPSLLVVVQVERDGIVATAAAERHPVPRP